VDPPGGAGSGPGDRTTARDCAVTVIEPEQDLVVRWPVEPAAAELAALALWDHGATAVEERTADDGSVVLIASYPTAGAARGVAADLGLETEPVPLGWRDEWKRHARAIEVGPSLLIAPAWRPLPVVVGRLVLGIDSGPCFGSGSHASTRLVLTLLADDPPIGLRVLDVGTGSGILAVAAARLGASVVTAVDLDPDSPAVTLSNARRNGVEDRIDVSTTDVADLEVVADLALVNVTAGVHAEVAGAVVARVTPGGRLLLAGLLPGQWRHVAGAYAGCEVVDRPALDGWVGAVLRKTSPHGVSSS
jgi:ribosomal protein L11 methyltransferase